MKNYFFILCFIAFISSNLLADQQSDDELSRLLNQADSALQGKSNPPSVVPKNKTVKKVKPKLTIEEDPTESATAHPPAEIKKQAALRPLSQGDIDQILAIDQQAAEREKYRGTGSFDLYMGAAIESSAADHPLEKDDDTFTYEGAAQFTGIYLEGSAAFLSFNAPEISLKSGLSIEGASGYLQSNVKKRRQGVENYNASFRETLIPLDGALGWKVLLSNRWTLSLHYGLSSEFHNQQGSRDSDTTSALFHGDALNVRAAVHVTETAEIFAKWQKRGLAQREQIDSQMYLLGVGVGVLR